jgi:outer membrane protein OmpA-like peptidoglycan-associated protein
MMPIVLSACAWCACVLPVDAAQPLPVASTQPPRIPFVVGLTTVRATSEARGDYENLRVIDAITPTGYLIAVSGEVPADDGSGLRDVDIRRRVSSEDQRASHTMRTYLHTGDPELFAGTVPGWSAAVIDELRKTGRTRLTYLDMGVIMGMSMVKHTFSGTITRVDGGTKTLPVLVNGKRVQLAVLHAKGRLVDAGASGDFEFYALDDPGNPLILRSSGPGFSGNVIKIDYPQPPAEKPAIESELAADRKTDVYGIYFAFARADIRPQSEIVLREIASVLKRHPDWKLRIDGHTDGIGGDASNLDLSRRRAAAVKAALVKRYAIAADRLTTGGFGESQPKADNATPEGRALNRRVELTRP